MSFNEGKTPVDPKQVMVERDGAVMILTLNNPSSRNSLTSELRDELGHAVREASTDRSVRSVLLAAAGPSFCAGGDFKMLEVASDPWAVHRRFAGLKDWLFPLISLNKPMVVAVNGHAAGGGMGLSLCGDVVFASEDAKFMAAFFRLGAVPDIGMMYHLPRLIGLARAKTFLFGNQTWTAQEAFANGLVTRVCSSDKLKEEALGEARRLADGPSEVMGLAKQLMARTFETGMHDMFAFEGLGQALAMSSSEFKEGLRAAVEKRPANFAAPTSQK
ncbi:MAG: enoyl-CoA hydratase/isomerase family protein [Bradyrhizobium sp.]|nr:enoyl-CoA hydratase/isomerase family protein [Bradyrhizobium sp.]